MEAKKPQSAKITLYRGWLDRGKHVWSPFVIKLEARLRFAGVAYDCEGGSTRTAPKGKIPYVQLGDGQVVGDSTLIIKDLVKRDILPDLNGRVGKEGRARDLALRAMVEEKLYFYHTHERWTENYYPMRDHILQALPYPMRILVGLLIYRNVVKTLHGQGTGRYTSTEIAEFRKEIWEAIADLLDASKRKRGVEGGEKKEPFWVPGGEEPTEADASLFGFVVSVLVCTASPESQALVKSIPVLVEYAERIHDWYFPDYEKWA